MKFSDVITLAKQGFTPADIREFLKLETEPEQAPAAADTAQEQKTEETPADDPEPEHEEQPAADPDPEEPDYKKLYEEEKAKRQAAARKQEVAVDPNKSVEDTLLDIAKMYI